MSTIVGLFDVKVSMVFITKLYSIETYQNIYILYTYTHNFYLCGGTPGLTAIVGGIRHDFKSWPRPLHITNNRKGINFF